MSLPRLMSALATIATLNLCALASSARAQECVGEKPRGGKWSTSAELYLDRARKNAKPEDKVRNYRQAVEILTEGFDQQPKNPKNYLLAGQAFIGLADFVSADGAWTTAEMMWTCYLPKVDTLRYNAWVQAYNRGARYSNSDDMDKALAEYQNAWVVYDRLPQPMIQLGTYYANSAIAATDPAAQAEARRLAIDYFREALAATERATRLRPANREEFSRATTFNLAQILAFEERYLEAAQAYEAFLAAEPDNIAAKSNMAVVVTLAAGAFRQEAELLEDGPEKEALLARADSLRGDASQHYSDLLARENLEADDYQNIGAGLSQIGMTEEAIVAYQKVLDLQPYNASSMEQLALALYGQQLYDSLLIVATRLVELYPLSMNNTAMLANAYRELERSEEALVILQGREDLKAELLGLFLTSQEGLHVLRGTLYNIGLQPQDELALQFDFYDDSGEVAATSAVTLTVPEQGTQSAFEVPVTTESDLAGFSYRVAGEAEPTSETDSRQ